jgi:hypothetical protein
VTLKAEAFASRDGARRVRLSMAPQIKADDRGETAGINGLLNESIASDRKARVSIALGGYGDDPQALQRWLAPQSQGYLVSIEPGNVEIHEHEVGAILDRESHSFEPIGRIDDLMAFGHEKLSDEKTVGGVVFDMKNA